MWEWVRANAILLFGRAGLVGLVIMAIAFIIMAISSVHEWLIDDPRYLRDGLLALLFLSLVIIQLWRWRQQQWRCSGFI